MTREVVLDTETTGLSALTGDRVVEIGCVELVNHIPTGRTFHVYINPQRAMPDDAFRVHGLDDNFLRDKPLFSQVAVDFIRFLGDATLVIHNAPFDMGFLNAELERAKLPSLINPVIDTVQLARDLNPGARVSLDALCKYYGIDNSRRALHGALLDAQILAEVYLELIGGRQVAFSLIEEVELTIVEVSTARVAVAPRQQPLARRITDAEIFAHQALIASLGPDPIWGHYLDKVETGALLQ